VRTTEPYLPLPGKHPLLGGNTSEGRESGNLVDLQGKE
jgi:hypothetical protein